MYINLRASQQDRDTEVVYQSQSDKIDSVDQAGKMNLLIQDKLVNFRFLLFNPYKLLGSRLIPWMK